MKAFARSRKRSPRFSKSGNWSKEAQAGDNRTTGSAIALAAASAAAFGTAFSSVPQKATGKASPIVCGEGFARLADQIGFDDPVEQGPQRFDAALFRAAAEDPEDVLNESSAFSAASALVALESLTKSTLPSRPTSSRRCASPGKLARPLRHARADRDQGRPSAATAAAAFWPLCAPRSEAMPARSAMRVELPSGARDRGARLRRRCRRRARRPRPRSSRHIATRGAQLARRWRG